MYDFGLRIAMLEVFKLAYPNNVSTQQEKSTLQNFIFKRKYKHTHMYV